MGDWSIRPWFSSETLWRSSTCWVVEDLRLCLNDSDCSLEFRQENWSEGRADYGLGWVLNSHLFELVANLEVRKWSKSILTFSVHAWIILLLQNKAYGTSCVSKNWADAFFWLYSVFFWLGPAFYFSARNSSMILRFGLSDFESRVSTWSSYSGVMCLVWRTKFVYLMINVSLILSYCWRTLG